MIDTWIEQLVAVFDVQPLTALIATRILRVVLILVVAVGIYLVLRYFLGVLERRIRQLDGQDDSTFDRRARTIINFVHSIGMLIVVVTAILALLDEFSINIAPLLASVGVAGLALGLGAQTLVKDAIAGLFILMEDQYHVGDVVRVGGVSGTVEALSMRTTRVRDVDGVLHIVPNGEIRVVSNLTVQWSRARVDIVVPYEAPLDQVFAALREVAAEVAQRDGISAVMQEPFAVTGPEELRDWGMLVRVMAKVNPGQQWNVMRALRRAISEDFKMRGLAIAVPRQQIVVMPAVEPREATG